ncbi:hypothetical protein CK203_116622 [Vitis vinifera]|uniref:Retrotransposon gag domain-containing protein n=1 Tax=Vitis vinifera TaxID=29760 RepID=A0A438D1N8_VITVI|nr:hypothetical protein CK203_116622 [Vitis vinifera]
MRTSEGAITWEDFDGAPVASLPAKFRMLEIERYTGIGCPRIHLRLYSTVMRAHGLDEAQEFLRQFAFNTVIDVSRRELEALRQRLEESVTSFISRWREKISQIIDQEGIARGLWSESSPTDSKGKKPSGGQRSGDVRAISSVGMRPSRHYQTVGQTPGLIACFCCTRHKRPPAHILDPSSADHYLCAEATTSVCSAGYAFESSFSEAHRGWIIDSISIQAFTPAIPPRFRMDLHCSTIRDQDMTRPLHCFETCYQDLIDQGDIHHMDLIEDDSIHMLSWDDGLPEPIVLHDSYEIDGVSLVPQTPAPFSLIPNEAPFQLTHPTPLVIGCQDTFVPFTLWPEDDDSEGREIQIVTRSGRIAQPPPPQLDHLRRCFDSSLESDRVETTTTLERLIHMMTAGRATCIVFSNDDLPPDGLDYVRLLYITVGCSDRRVSSVLLDNGSALNVCPLATVITLRFAPSDFGPST